MVSETWLSDDIRDEALHFPGIPGFSVVRNDIELMKEMVA